MQFQEIAGNQEVKQQLIVAVKNNRIAHTQLFFGLKGSAKLALALSYSQYINCKKPEVNDSCGKCSNCIKHKKLEHPDLHLIFPVVKTTKIKKPISENFLQEWRGLVKKNPYLSLSDWEEQVLKSEAKNKKCKIYVEEASKIHKNLTLKNYEAKYKIIIIWMPEEMTSETANKLLKILEEPPKQTIFILVSEHTEKLLPTIISRTQMIRADSFKQRDLLTHFKTNKEINKDEIIELYKTKKGDLGEILQAISKQEKPTNNLQYFKELMRNSFQNNIQKTNDWLKKISEKGRRGQIAFIEYSIRIIRECLIFNYTDKKLLNITEKEQGFIDNFSRYVNKENIIPITEKLEETARNIERNGNSKIIFFELSLSLRNLLKNEKEIQVL